MRKAFLGVFILIILATCSIWTFRDNGSSDINKAEIEDSTKYDDSIIDNTHYLTSMNGDNKLGIVRHPKVNVTSYANKIMDKISFLPKYKVGNEWDLMMPSCDLSSFDLKNRLSDLMHVSFDTKTKWPKHLPVGFDTNKLMNLGKNPGLGIRELHKEGITGKGIGIAIFDGAILIDHNEFKDQIKTYEENHLDPNFNIFHGTPIASIAVGKNIGVAPGANLYYIADTHDGPKGCDLSIVAKSINRVLEINKGLPKKNKIRVISMSWGLNKSYKGYKEAIGAVNKAKKDGIFFVSASLNETYNFNFNGLGRRPLSNPEEFSSYEPAPWWEDDFYAEQVNIKDEKLLIPMDSRCVASPAGDKEYMYFAHAGWSWSIPYIAGLYALACQVKPDITPQYFWSIALNTGETIDIKKEGKHYKLGKIVNPQKLIDMLAKQ